MYCQILLCVSLLWGEVLADTLFYQPMGLENASEGKEFKVSMETEGIYCMDQKTICSSSQTCCKLSTGLFGCCRFSQAVCCGDMKHCCPQNYTCDLSHGKCTESKHALPWLAHSPVQEVENVTCGDRRSQCPEGSTCCKLSSGQYGCCPFPQAVCCSDRLHCCPRGMTCDVTKGSCKRGYSSIRWREPQLALPRVPVTEPKLPYRIPGIEHELLPIVREVICPDGRSECPNGSTCCKMSSGDYGCCPLPEAVCCPDHLHCCPYKTVCHVREGKCSHHGGELTPWHSKTYAKHVPVES